MWLVVGIVLFGFSLFVPHGAWQLQMVALSILAINYCFFGIINKQDSRFYAYKFYLVSCLVIPFYLFLNLLFFPGAVEDLMVSTSLFTAYPWSLYAFCLAPSIAVLFAWLIGKPMSRKGGLGFKDYFDQADGAMDMLSLCLLVPVFGAWINQAIPSLPGAYYLFILNKTFAFFPFFVGYRFFRNPTVGTIWLGALVLGLGLAFVTGNRGMGFFPAFFFSLGFGLSLKRKQLYYLGLMGLMVFGVYASGVSSAIREATGGRTSLRNLDVGAVVEAWPKIVEHMSRNESTVGGKNTNPFHKGLKRMVPWSRVVVPNMTHNDGVPQRGFYAMADDYKAFFYLSKLTNITGIMFYPTVINARPYGFRVTLNYNTRTGKNATSTVPFGVEVDGWSRFGVLGAAIYIAVMFGLMAAFERLNQKVFRRNPNARLLCLSVIWGLPFDYFTTYGLVHSARQYLLQTIMAFICAYFACKVAKFLHQNISLFSSKGGQGAVGPR